MKEKKAAGQIRYPNTVFHDAAGQEQLLRERGDLEPRPGRGPFAQYSWELLLAAQETVDDGEALSGYANILGMEMTGYLPLLRASNRGQGPPLTRCWQVWQLKQPREKKHRGLPEFAISCSGKGFLVGASRPMSSSAGPESSRCCFKAE